MAMSEAAKAARRKYVKDWKKANPDKVKAQIERYWERKAAEDTAPIKNK